MGNTLENIFIIALNYMDNGYADHTVFLLFVYYTKIRTYITPPTICSTLLYNRGAEN